MELNLSSRRRLSPLIVALRGLLALSLWTVSAQANAQFAQVAAGGAHTCGILTDSTLLCWGRNDQGQLGTNSTIDNVRPSPVVGLQRKVSRVELGGSQSCALTLAGSLVCWGENSHGQLGDGTRTNRLMPTEVSGVANVAAIAAGAFHTCALEADGDVWCWGRNSEGQLGIGTRVDQLRPVRVPGLGAIRQIAAGGFHTCAVTESSGVRCWGSNASGQLGDGTQEDAASAISASGFTGPVVAVAAGLRHSCALLTNGLAQCWGGDGLFELTPSNVGQGGFESISGGGAHQCFLRTNDEIYCLGRNLAGQLGDGSNVDRTTPRRVSGFDGSVEVRAIAAGGVHTCALLENSQLICWGGNGVGQLGASRVRPSDIAGVDGLRVALRSSFADGPL